MKAVLGNRYITMLAQRGAGLIEVLIALTIFALGVVTMSALQLRTASLTMDSTQRSYVVAKSQDIADRIRSSGIAPGLYLGTFNEAEDFCLNPDSSVLCAVTPDGPQCTVEQHVATELHDAFCVGDGSYEKQVAGWQVTIGCERPDAGGLVASIDCDELGAQVVLQSSWYARSLDEDISIADAPRDSMILRFAP